MLPVTSLWDIHLIVFVRASLKSSRLELVNVRNERKKLATDADAMRATIQENTESTSTMLSEIEVREREGERAPLQSLESSPPSSPPPIRC